jgi:hypothetical protein
MEVNGSEFIEITGRSLNDTITKRYDHIIGGLSMMQSLFVIHPFQLPAGWKFSGSHIRCITWNNIYKARLSILILSKDLPV